MQTKDQTRMTEFTYACLKCEWAVHFTHDMARNLENPVRLIPGGCPDCRGDVRVLIKTDNGLEV